jgi:Right handed beta helix region
MQRKSRVALLIGAMLATMVATASVAAAPPGSGCGMIITQSTTLTADIGPCGRGGIVIAADDIDVNLNGHTISGKARAGDGVGILFDGVTAARVSNGTVTGFDAGVAIVGGGSNTVHLLDIRGNIGSLTAVRPAYGDGVVIMSSSFNWIFNNTITNNGPFSGIAVLSDGVTPSETNVIDRNRVVDNDVARATANDDIGIRIEGPNALGTYITRNRIIANGLDGIAVFEAAGSTNASTWIDRNVVQGNGFHGMANRKGDGIFLADQADSSLVNENEVTGNAANGIRVASVTNRILATTALGNGAYPGVSAFDLNDENPSCADNEWNSSVFETASQTCVQ